MLRMRLERLSVVGVLAQAAVTKHHSLGGFNPRNLLLTFWRLGVRDPGAGEGSFPGCERTRQLALVST